MLRHCLSELMCIDFSEVVLHGCTYTVSAFLYEDIMQFLVLKWGRLHVFFCTWVFINGRGSSPKIERELIQDSTRSLGSKSWYQSSFSWYLIDTYTIYTLYIPLDTYNGNFLYSGGILVYFLPPPNIGLYNLYYVFKCLSNLFKNDLKALFLDTNTKSKRCNHIQPHLTLPLS